MITVDRLWALVDHLTPAPLPAERGELGDLVGRVLREHVQADLDQPPFDRTAFDGYLARLDQARGPVRLLGQVPPGVPAPAAPGHGEAWRVLTGAALPSGPLGIVMQEQTARRPDGRIELLTAPDARMIRRRASQCRAGDVLLPAGTALRPGAGALLASVGVTAPLVTRRPRVAYVVTGDELVPPESTPGPGQIRDSNSALVSELLQAAHADLVFQASSGDTPASTLEDLRLALAEHPDILLVGGGASVGDHDHSGALLRELGFTVHADKVASRPGKPLITAARGATLAFGLPGNPLSHFVCFHLFVARALARLRGTAPPALTRVPLAPGAPLRSDPRETWWPATLTPLGYAPLPWTDSSDLTVLARTHALLRIPSSAAPETSADALLL
jgi:molybdopterin molybdotransferase